MPKNIILCSDGTGNSGGKGYGTNVWRLYLAVNHHPHNAGMQVAFYDDGVGSQDFRVLKAIGGAFGWGISENLCELYAFLMLHYQPGDQIYLFGFSRGAFTIRTLGNMIRYCGVADCDGMSANGINQGAAEALAAYKRRHPQNQPTGGAGLAKFKLDYGRWSDDSRQSKDVPIHFIGVWDTVEALGLPIDEMKHGLDYFFGLQLHAGENDLHPGIHHAFHALSIDDERLTFHPVLWDEALKVEGQVVEQVWFPGVHANVGGGYPKDQLSLVALTWIMEKADACGLRFHQTLWDDYQRDHDVDGQLYDSRAGLSGYYRYAPRDIQKISDAAHVQLAKIHVSVLERILNATDDYAPAGMPLDYQVEPPMAVPAETNRADRHKQLKIVCDIVWWRRVLYYVLLTWTVALVGSCWVLWTDEKIPDYGSFGAGERGLYYVLNPLITLVGMMVPEFLAPALNALRQCPYVSGSLLITLVVVFFFNRKLIGQTRELSVRAWHMSLALHKPETPAGVTPRTWWIRIAHWFRHKPASLALDRASHALVRWVAPMVTKVGVFVGLPVLLIVLIVIWGSLLSNPAAESTIDLAVTEKAEFLFDTRNSMQATPVIFQEGEKYRITVLEWSDWFDRDHEASPDGLMDQPSSLQKWMGWTRRDPSERWFKLMAAVGTTDAENTYVIGHKGTIRALRDGRLFLFVNDTLGFYHNNRGTAKIRVECISWEGD